MPLLLLAALPCVQGLQLAGREYRLAHTRWTSGAQARLVALWGGLLFRAFGSDLLYFLSKDNDTSASVKGLNNVATMDLVMTRHGVVWVGTTQGLFLYVEGRIVDLGVMKKSVHCMAAGAASDLYVVDVDFVLYSVDRLEATPIPGIEVFTMAFTRLGTMYYTEWYSTPVLRREGGLGGEPVMLSGLPPGGTSLLEVDLRDDALYICHNDGLFRALPGSDTILPVEGLGEQILGMGFAPNGDMYLGTSSQILTYSPVEYEESSSKSAVATEAT